MTIIIIVALIVASISLYEYFSARDWQQVTSSDRNNIVFADRNQEYGAYAMRRDYDKRMVIILFSFIGSIGLIFGIFSYIKSLPVELPPPPPPIDIKTIEPKKDKEELPPPPPEPPVPVVERLIAFPPPVIVDKPTETELPTQEQAQETKTGATTQEGKDGFNAELGDPKKDEVEAPKIEPILDAVEEDAVFAGNVTSFINSNIIAENLDEANGTIYVKFCVEKDGQLSNISIRKGIGVAADKEAIRIVKLMRGWSAGKQNGKAVRSWYTLPIKIVTE